MRRLSLASLLAAILCLAACSDAPKTLSRSNDIEKPDNVAVTNPDSPFPDEPGAHRLYDRMNRAIREARSLSYMSQYQFEVAGKETSNCSYQVWLKKPNYFRMETRSVSGEPGGILIGDGDTLWIYWPSGRPKWDNVRESESDERTRLTSYMSLPAPQSQHSIQHEARYLGAGMIFPVLDSSTFHGYVDSLQKYVGAVRSLGTESVRGDPCDVIEVSILDQQRSWYFWLSQQDHLPRKLKEIVRLSQDCVISEEWSSVAVGEDIPDTMFAWKPPAGWAKWELPDDEEPLIKAGGMAPDFELDSVDGKRIRLSDYRGKTVWLTFWRVGCPPCREETPYLQELYDKHGRDGLVVLGVNVSDDQDITLDFLRKQGVTFPNILEVSEEGDKVCSAYGVGTLPTNYLIDGDGIVLDAWFGYHDVEPQVAAALRNAFTKSGAAVRQE